MKKFLGLIGVAAACGACCAFPLALPVLGGFAASSLGFTIGWEAAVLAGIAASVVLAVILRRRRAMASTCALPAQDLSGRSCGSSCSPSKGGVA